MTMYKPTRERLFCVRWGSLRYVEQTSAFLWSSCADSTILADVEKKQTVLWDDAPSV